MRIIFSDLLNRFWWAQILLDTLVIIPIFLVITLALQSGGVAISPLVMLTAALCIVFLKQFLHWGLSDADAIEWPAPPPDAEVLPAFYVDGELRHLENQLQSLTRNEPSAHIFQQLIALITARLWLRYRAEPAAASQFLSAELAQLYQTGLTNPNHPPRLTRTQLNRYLQELHNL